MTGYHTLFAILTHTHLPRPFCETLFMAAVASLAPVTCRWELVAITMVWACLEPTFPADGAQPVQENPAPDPQQHFPPQPAPQQFFPQQFPGQTQQQQQNWEAMLGREQLRQQDVQNLEQEIKEGKTSGIHGGLAISGSSDPQSPLPGHSMQSPSTSTPKLAPCPLPQCVRPVHGNTSKKAYRFQ